MVMAVVRQAWWASLALLVALAQLVMCPLALATDEDTESQIASFVILLAGAAIMLAGLYLRPRRRVPGNVLILVGCVFALLWFWTLLLPIGGIVVAIGVLLSGWRDQPARP